jgi:hypothetical protein
VQKESLQIMGRLRNLMSFWESCQDSSCAELKAKTKWSQITKPPPHKKPPTTKMENDDFSYNTDLLNLLAWKSWIQSWGCFWGECS